MLQVLAGRITKAETSSRHISRPLKRVIQRNLQDPLAQMLLAGEVLDGAIVQVTAGQEGLIIGDYTVGDDDAPRMKLVH